MVVGGSQIGVSVAHSACKVDVSRRFLSYVDACVRARVCVESIRREIFQFYQNLHFHIIRFKSEWVVKHMS
jgi:hypothetical protein